MAIASYFFQQFFYSIWSTSGVSFRSTTILYIFLNIDSEFTLQSMSVLCTEHFKSLKKNTNFGRMQSKLIEMSTGVKKNNGIQHQILFPQVRFTIRFTLTNACNWNYYSEKLIRVMSI